MQARVAKVFVEMESMLRLSRRAGEGQAGMLAIGLTPSAASSPLIDALYTYRQQNPEILLEVQELSSLDMEAALRRRAIDVGLMRPNLIASDIRRIPIYREPICLIVRREHPLASCSGVTAKDLIDLPLISYEHSAAPYLHMRVREIFSRYRISPNIVQESRLPTILTLVEAGVGGALAPYSPVGTRTTLRAIPLIDNDAAYAEFVLASLSSESNMIATDFVQRLCELSTMLPPSASTAAGA